MNECFNCKKRRVGCHAECPDYIVPAQAARERRDAEYANKLFDYLRDTSARVAKL